MADDKQYFYRRTLENEFENDDIIYLESLANGYKFINILHKMYLRSLKHDGKLMISDKIPYNSIMLAKITRHNKKDVEKAIKIFEKLDLIDVLKNGSIYMNHIQNYIGKSTTEADRQRAFRARKENEIRQMSDKCHDKNDEEKGQMSDKCHDKTTPELELDLDLKEEEENITIKEKEIYYDANYYMEQIKEALEKDLSTYPDCEKAKMKKWLTARGTDFSYWCESEQKKFINYERSFWKYVEIGKKKKWSEA